MSRPGSTIVLHPNKTKIKMETRLNFFEKGQNAMKALFGIGGYLKKSTIEQPLKELIAMRVSQINKCAFCIDMHYKDARAHGETEQRLYGLSAWQESPYYTKRERAALAWIEGVNKCETPDSLYADVKEHFTEEEIVDLTMLASTTGIWNRLNISFQNEAGTYRVGQFG
jgi:AhpD family alkylhydroperoxidase